MNEHANLVYYKREILESLLIYIYYYIILIYALKYLYVL